MLGIWWYRKISDSKILELKYPKKKKSFRLKKKQNSKNMPGVTLKFEISAWIRRLLGTLKVH